MIRPVSSGSYVGSGPSVMVIRHTPSGRTRPTRNRVLVARRAVGSAPNYQPLLFGNAMKWSPQQGYAEPQVARRSYFRPFRTWMAGGGGAHRVIVCFSPLSRQGAR